MSDWLGPLGAETLWHTTDSVLYGQMATLIRDGQWDINKLGHYLAIYDSVFASFRDRPVRMLEIGVSFGGSLELWRKYFNHADTKIVGIDCNSKCFMFDAPDRNVFVRIGSQQDTEFLQSVVKELGPFDIIVDDGSHIPSYTLTSFQHLFLNGLSSGGVYVVEDLHTCYAVDILETYDGAPTFIEFVKELIDVMHAVYRQTPTGDEFANAFEPENPGRKHDWVVPVVSTLISSIEIHDCIAVVHKGLREVPRQIRRWSHDRMVAVLNEDASKFLKDNPHLGISDRTRRDWMT